MADEVIRRSGSAADHGSFTGASGEWTHDTTLKAIRVHDGSQAGGYPIFHEGYVESAPDGGTDAYSADARRPVSAGETVRADFTSANTTTTPTFENTQGTPSGALTITPRDGSALWEGALSGVHELQLASGGGSWLVLDPNPLDGDQPASVTYADTQVATRAQIATGTYTGDGSTSQSITGVGFQPVYVKIWERATTNSDPIETYETTDTIIDDISQTSIREVGGSSDGPDVVQDTIVSLDSDGFTVDDRGSDASPNTNGQVYNFMAIG